MLLIVPLPCSIRLQAEQIHLIGADFRLFREKCAPDAVAVLCFIGVELAVHPPELVRGIDVKNEASAGLEIAEHPAERLPDVLFPCQIVQGIQRGHRRVHRLQQMELRRRRFIHSLRQHLFRQVGSRHVVPLRRQQAGNGAGTAGQIQNRPHRDGAFLEQLYQIVCPPPVHSVGHQAVITGGQRIVAAHASGFLSAVSSSFMRANTRS